MKVIPYSIFGLLACAKERTWHTHTHRHYPNSHSLWQAALAAAAGDTSSEIPASLLGLEVKYSDQTMAKNDVVSAVCAIAPGDGTSGGSLPSQPMWHFLTVVIHDMAISESIGSFEVWCPNLICFSVGFLCKGLDRRHINHYTMEAFYALYKMWCEGQEIEEKEVASSRRFRDIYSQQWASTLQMRELSQHARCLLYFALVFLSLSVCKFKELSLKTLWIANHKTSIMQFNAS